MKQSIKHRGKLFVISAPSGAGKTTLCQAVISRLQGIHELEKSITTTTRSPRPFEYNGIDYHFLDKETFVQLIQKHHFLETTYYDGHYYGSSSSILDKVAAGTSILLATDQVGAHTIKERFPEAILIWITVPHLQELEKRLTKRAGESPTAIQHRMTLATQELAAEEKEQFFTYHIVNDTFEKAVQALEKIICKELE